MLTGEHSPSENAREPLNLCKECGDFVLYLVRGKKLPDLPPSFVQKLEGEHNTLVMKDGGFIIETPEDTFFMRSGLGAEVEIPTSIILKVFTRQFSFSPLEDTGWTKPG